MGVNDDALEDGAETEEDETEARELVYGSVNEFVREYLRNVYRRRIDGQPWMWVGDWWRYPEAEDVLDALWRAWEHLNLDGRTGKSVWWRDHARPHMESLMTKGTSPFPAEAVKAQSTTVLEPLPYVEPPAGSYPDQRGPAAVAAAIVHLLAHRDLPDWEIRIAGYLAHPGAVDVDELPVPAATSDAVEVLDGEGEAVDVVVGELLVQLARTAPADPWLATDIQPLT
ncbi:hypothetical protein GCM10010988_40340 [Cnuibacter physcomitrellae]|uniref:Uncharacterized protein n=1 Tax=Cnuibacter physcomitrellae TaxID=1619308 RepID=A0A1X9LTI8_9MICO|nr:DUF4913 domain-containing protein [Cnuibacter physcomitrellae]ARJ07722.1 hypothetical protein B5808_19920 [Cnuibacter physcomitrellae]GGI42698.1 hypothetical protein GCM10010988_40340 [Cnuibacter physcomitrellae]